MILAYPLIAASAFGLTRLMAMVSIPGRWIGRDDGRYTAGPLVWALAFLGLISYYWVDLKAPVNGPLRGLSGGRRLRRDLRSRRRAGGRPHGWSLYYGRRRVTPSPT